VIFEKEKSPYDVADQLGSAKVVETNNCPVVPGFKAAKAVPVPVPRISP